MLQGFETGHAGCVRDAGGGAGSPGYEVVVPVPVFPISILPFLAVAGLRVLLAAGSSTKRSIV